MLQLVTPHDYAACADALAEMYRLRFRVFKNRLDWDVTTSGDMERDSYDDLGPVYLLQRNTLGDLTGCVRLLPTTGPTMLRDTFAALAESASIREFCLRVTVMTPVLDTIRGA